MSQLDPQPSIADSETAPPRQPVHPILWVLSGLMLAVHLAQVAAVEGWLGRAFLPFSIYDRFGFFTEYFDAALQGAAVPAQFWWSFISHGFVHGSWLHLGMNTAIFLAIGHGIVRAGGIRVLLIVFFAAVVAGAAFHGLISTHAGVLIGASGGVFGQLGMVVTWRAQMLRRHGLSRAPIWRLLMGLTAMNAILAVGFAGLGGAQLAWEAHLGGFVAGWLLGVAFPQRGA
ncbi:MAG: rhomboid family intramembrane serine protease [Pseudomonadota bacterium]